MSLKPITFKKACKIVEQSLACILDGNALSYPAINEDFDGHDCIEINYQDDGLVENTFNRKDKYFIDEVGVLHIHHNTLPHTVQFLKIDTTLALS